MARGKKASPIDRDLFKKSRTLNSKLFKLEKQLDKVLQSTVLAPNRTASYWRGVKREVRSIYNDMEKVYNQWTINNLPTAYQKSIYLEERKIRRTVKAYNKTAKKTATEFIKGQYSRGVTSALVDDSIRDFTRASTLGEKNVNRYLSEARKTTNNLWLAGEDITGSNMINAMKANPANKKLIKNMLNSQYFQVIDKNGNPRNYTNRYYAEMVQRVKWHEAQSAAVRGVAANYNTDLIRVSAHNTTTEICQQYEGMVMSLSGKSKEFPVADQVPPYHVNCIHFITVVFEETLKATGTEKGFIEFGKGQTSKPPFPDTFVPVTERAAA